jgi:hypothetical protein
VRTTGRRPTIDAALLILLVGFAFSMAANLLWTWEGGVVRILGGALASLALPGAIHLWPRIPVAAPVSLRIARWTVDVPVMRAVRALAMTGIAVMAAFTTFSHASSLLVEHGETPLLAALYPVMTELLVVMGVLARHTATVAAPQGARAPRKPAVKSQVESSVGTTTPPVVPTEPPAPSELSERRDASGTATEWARAAWPCTARQIQDATGVRKSSAHRIVNKLAAELAS